MFFTLGRQSALSLRALKKHLTSFKRLSSLVLRSNDYRWTPSNWRRKGVRIIEDSEARVSSSLLRTFFFNDRYLLTRRREERGRREQCRVKIDFIIRRTRSFQIGCLGSASAVNFTVITRLKNIVGKETSRAITS